MRASVRIATAALAMAAPACKRAQRPDAAALAVADTRPVVCDRVELAGEWTLAGTAGRAESVAAAHTPRGALIAWMEQPSAGGAFAATQLVAMGGAAGTPRRAIELAAPPAQATPPTVSFDGAAGWVMAWDERSGCRAAGTDAQGGARGASVSLGSAPCFAVANGTALRPSGEGWRAVTVAAGADGSRAPVVAPAGDRWLVRASDGVTVYTGDDGRSVSVSRAGESARIAVGTAAARVVQLAVERVGLGYVIAWASEGGHTTTVQRVGADLAAAGSAEELPVGGAGLGIAAFQGEAWIAVAGADGAIEVFRLNRDGRAQGLALMRSGTITSVAIAGVAGGAIVAYGVERDGRASVIAYGARCAARDGAPRPQ